MSEKIATTKSQNTEKQGNVKIIKPNEFMRRVKNLKEAEYNRLCMFLIGLADSE